MRWFNEDVGAVIFAICCRVESEQAKEALLGPIGYRMLGKAHI